MLPALLMRSMVVHGHGGHHPHPCSRRQRAARRGADTAMAFSSSQLYVFRLIACPLVRQRLKRLRIMRNVWHAAGLFQLRATGNFAGVHNQSRRPVRCGYRQFGVCQAKLGAAAAIQVELEGFIWQSIAAWRGHRLWWCMVMSRFITHPFG